MCNYTSLINECDHFSMLVWWIPVSVINAKHTLEYSWFSFNILNISGHHIYFTHRALNKMSGVLQKTILNQFLHRKRQHFMQYILLKCIRIDAMHSNSASIHEMTWRLTGGKPLPEPMVNRISNPTVRHNVLKRIYADFAHRDNILFFSTSMFE